MCQVTLLFLKVSSRRHRRIIGLRYSNGHIILNQHQIKGFIRNVEEAFALLHGERECQ